MFLLSEYSLSVVLLLSGCSAPGRAANTAATAADFPTFWQAIASDQTLAADVRATLMMPPSAYLSGLVGGSQTGETAALTNVDRTFATLGSVLAADHLSSAALTSDEYDQATALMDGFTGFRSSAVTVSDVAVVTKLFVYAVHLAPIRPALALVDFNDGSDGETSGNLNTTQDPTKDPGADDPIDLLWLAKNYGITDIQNAESSILAAAHQPHSAAITAIDQKITKVQDKYDELAGMYKLLTGKSSPSLGTPSSSSGKASN